MLLNKNAPTLCKTRYEDAQVNENPTQEIPELWYYTDWLPSVGFSTFVYLSCGHRSNTWAGLLEQGRQPALYP